jgi:hypothetical protein
LKILEYNPLQEQHKTRRDDDQYAALHVALVLHTDIIATKVEMISVARVMMMNLYVSVDLASKMIIIRTSAVKFLVQEMEVEKGHLQNAKARYWSKRAP